MLCIIGTTWKQYSPQMEMKVQKVTRKDIGLEHEAKHAKQEQSIEWKKFESWNKAEMS